MKEQYIVDNGYLKTKFGLDLYDFSLGGQYVEPIINMAFGKAITRVFKLNDNFKYEKDIEKALDNDTDLVGAFYKLQYQVIYNLIYLGDDDPINKDVDDIICFDLHWGKINGFQKSIFGNRG